MKIIYKSCFLFDSYTTNMAQLTLTLTYYVSAHRLGGMARDFVAPNNIIAAYGVGIC